MGVVVDTCIWQDIWIASQAIQQGFPVLTRNKKDFEDIPGIQLLVMP